MTRREPERIVVQLPDGTRTPVRIHPASTAAGSDATQDGGDHPAVLIVPGLGVPGSWYDDVARALAARGIDTAVGELRGQGGSRPRPGSDSAFGYHDQVAVDLPAMLEVVRERFVGATPYLVGHSMGGQLSLLYAARARHRVAGVVLVAAGVPYYRAHPGRRAPLLLLGSTAMSMTATLAGYWPGDRIGGFGRQSRVLVSDWARLARSGRFTPAGADVDYEERLRRCPTPVLAVTIEGDDLSPRTASERLLAKLVTAPVTRWHDDRPVGHNGWIRDHDPTVERIVGWIAGDRAP